MTAVEHPDIHIETGENLSPRTPKNRNIKTPSGNLEVWPEWLVEELEEHLKSPVRQQFIERTISQTEKELNKLDSQISSNNNLSEQIETETPISPPVVDNTQNVEQPIVTKQEVSLFGPHPIFGLCAIGLIWGFVVHYILILLHFPIFQHQLFCVGIIAIPSLIIWLLILQMDNMLYKSIINTKVNNVD